MNETTRFLSRRVVDEALAEAAPGGIVLLEAPSGWGKASAIAASPNAFRVVTASADELDPAGIEQLRCTAAASGAALVLTATGRMPRLRLLYEGCSPIVVDADRLRFDVDELARAAGLAGVRLNRAQADRVHRLTGGRPPLVTGILSALPHERALTDEVIESAWHGISTAARERLERNLQESPPDGLSSALARAPFLTAAMSRHLTRTYRGGDALLHGLAAEGLTAPTERFGEQVLCVTPVFDPHDTVDDEWLTLLRAEYERVGAYLELAAMLVDEEDWPAFRALTRRRYTDLIREGRRFAVILARVPTTIISADGWLVVMERMLAEELGATAPVRRVRKPHAALPLHDRAWLQAAKIQLELDSGAFSKAVAEASYLARLLEQSELDADTSADLWMLSALPAFLTGAHRDTVRRSTRALAAALRHARTHAGLFSAGVLALSYGLRGELARAVGTLHDLSACGAEDGLADSFWAVPAHIARAVIRVERGEVAEAETALRRIEPLRLGSFWAVYASVGARVALAGGPAAAAAAIDRVRVIEQLAGGVPASNRHRGVLAAATALLHLSLDQTDEASDALADYDDGRESSLVASALIRLARGDVSAVAAAAERWSARNTAPVTLVSAAALRVLAEGTDSSIARRDDLARECGLVAYSALIQSLGHRR